MAGEGDTVVLFSQGGAGRCRQYLLLPEGYRRDKRLSPLSHHTGHGPFRTRPLTSVKSKRVRNKRENGIDCAAGRDYNGFIRQHKPSLSAEAEFYFFIKTLIIPGRYFCPQGAELFRYFFSEFYEV